MNPYELLKRQLVKAAGLPVKASKRLYGAADYTRLTQDWAPASTSADAEIVMSLRVLRNRSRQLVRDNEYAKNAVRQVQQNVIGTGVRMLPNIQSTRGALHNTLNDSVTETWDDWWKEPDSVHTAGILSGPDIERFVIGNLIESGEAFIRIIRSPFGDSKIPLALELIESDRVMDQWTQQTNPVNGNLIRMGVEVDQWHRPLAYWCWPTHPGDWQFSTFSPSAFQRIPAEDMIHLYMVDRWPQTRGVPWFHAAMKRLNNMAGYEESEIIAARGSAAIMGFITSPDIPTPDDVQEGQRVDDMEPGQIRHLQPGETFSGFNPARPNATMEPFLRLMLRGVASAIGMSYETLSRDYSNTNYSSARAAQMEDRDLWKVLQHWFIGTFRKRLHKEFMEAAVMSNQIRIADFYTNQTKYTKAHFRPRGWSWIDPTKEVNAFRDAVRAGFMTVSDVIGQTGNGLDADDMFAQRRKELDVMDELDLVFDTDAAQVDGKGVAQPEPAPTAEEVGIPTPTAAVPENSTDDSKPDADASKSASSAKAEK